MLQININHQIANWYYIKKKNISEVILLNPFLKGFGFIQESTSSSDEPEPKSFS